MNSSVEIPDNSAALSEIQKKIKTVEIKIKEYDLDEQAKKKLSVEVWFLLDKLGQLSNDVCRIKEPLEREYFKMNPKAPALARKLFMDHYQSLHKDYDKLKNKCFKLYNKLDPFMDEKELEDED